MKILLSLFFLLGMLGPVPAHAHEGHDHENAPPPRAGSIAPRFEARSDLFELVGSLQGEELVLYLDQTASNAPIVNADIEIESGSFKAKASPGSAGEFRLPAGALSAAGNHALTITIEAGDDADLLSANFDRPPPAVSAPATTMPVSYGIAAVLLLLGAIFAWRFVSRKPA